MYLGPVKLGDTLLIQHLCKNSSQVPTEPTGNVNYRIYGLVAGSVALLTNGTGTLAATDSQTGFRTGTKTISGGDGYVAGQSYGILVTATVSGNGTGEIHTFTVV